MARATNDPHAAAHGFGLWDQTTWARHYGDQTWEQVHANDHRRERAGDPEFDWTRTHTGAHNHER